jgi:hypothetical protein
MKPPMNADQRGDRREKHSTAAGDGGIAAAERVEEEFFAGKDANGRIRQERSFASLRMTSSILRPNGGALGAVEIVFVGGVSEDLAEPPPQEFQFGCLRFQTH